MDPTSVCRVFYYFTSCSEKGVGRRGAISASDHVSQENHVIDWDDAKIIDKDSQKTNEMD